jgi:GntR family transcriptional regulator
VSSPISHPDVNPRGHQPLFLRVAGSLRGEIREGRLPPGQRLAPERELCERFGVSRNTLRHGLLDLEAAGLLVAAGRRGWYVAASPVVERSDGPDSLTAWAREAGLSLASRVTGRGVGPATALEAVALGIAPGDDVYRLERVRIVDGTALSVDRATLSARLAGVLDAVDFSHASLYEELARGVGLVPRNRECTLRAATADERHASLLEVAVGAPLLVVEETVFDQHGEPLEFALLTNRGDRWRYRTTQLSPQVERLAPAGGASRYPRRP